ncbi:MAG TPA: polysaccharide biosynthesis/export family protein [Longimicrobiales bacterium]|nr:polysaccharide biosynthesis/export family protein [Longimicrobiales bacterium]
MNRLSTALIILTFALMGCASSGASGDAGSLNGGGAAAGASSSAAAPTSGFPLRAGDVIRLRIWREPDLSGEFTVTPQGTVTFPKLGELAVVDRPPEEVEEEIRSSFDRFLRNPSIEITMLRRVNILGFVRAPGLYPVDPTMSLRDVLAMAGGVLPNGREDRLELLRGEARIVTPVTGGMRLDDLGVRSGDQLYVPERPWLNRNASIVAGVASTLITASVSLIIALRPWE